MVKTSINLSEKALNQGRILAAARKMSFSELVESLVIKNFNVEEITKAAQTAIIEDVKKEAKKNE